MSAIQPEDVDPGSRPHSPVDPGDGHSHDDHGHDEDILGPIDFAAWGAGALGVAIGLVMWLCFVLATSVAART